MRSWPFLPLCLCASVAPLSSSGCGPVPEAAPARAAAPTAPAQARVTVVSPARATVRLTAEQPGQVESYEVTPLHPRIAGYVESWSADLGDRVKKGQVLAELSVPELEAERDQKRAMVEQAEADRKQAEAGVTVAESVVASAKAALTEAKAGIGRAEADVARWQAESRRTEQLARESAVTGSLRDETRSRLRAAESAHDEAKARVASAEAALGEARARLDKARADADAATAAVAVARHDARRAEAMTSYLQIVAPFEGVITRREIDTGDLTVPGGSSPPLFVVARGDRVRVVVGVPEAVAAAVEVGDTARVRIPRLEGGTFEGTVTRTSWSLDPATRTLRTEIDLPNPDGRLRAGLYATATIIAEEHADALTIPSAALVKEGDRSFCMVVADGRAHRREVQVGLIDGERAEIRSGLDGAESIVAANAASLADDQPVEAVQPEGPAASKPKP